MTGRRSAALVLLVIAGMEACGDPERVSAPPRDAGPVARPSSVVGTLAIRDVSELGAAATKLVGAALTPGESRIDARPFLAALAGLPEDAAASLSPRGDAWVIALKGGTDRVAWALPVDRSRAAAPITLREGRAAKRAGRHLVVAPDEASLRELAPWIEGALARERHEHALRLVVEEAMASELRDRLLEGTSALAEELRAEARAMRVQMGRAPEIGEPEAVAGWVEDLGRRLARAAGEASLEATADLSEDALHLRVALEARAGSTLAADLAGVSAGSSVLAERMSDGAVLAALVRRTPAERRDATERTVALLERLAGARLEPGEAAALGGALRAWDEATGVESAIELRLVPPSPRDSVPRALPPAILVRAQAAQPEAAAAAARAVAERLGQGHLRVVGERIGLWSAAPPLEVATLDAEVAIAAGAGAQGALAAVAARSWAARPEVAALLRSRPNAALVAAGGVSLTAMLELAARAFGPELARLAATARTGASSEQAVWGLFAEGRRLEGELRVPPPEVRAIVGAVRRSEP